MKIFPKTMQPGLAVCKRCESFTPYSPTNCKDIVIRCSNTNCNRYICTIDCCYRAYSRAEHAKAHQQNVHRANADLSKCHFCKTFKDRTTGIQSAQCPKCGIFWCLFKYCTFEAVNLRSVSSHIGQTDHDFFL